MTLKLSTTLKMCHFENTQKELQKADYPSAASEPFIPAPESLWLVIVESRYNVIRVCASGRGFYIPGQEPCWGFSHVDEWIQEIIPPNVEPTHL